MHAYRPAALPKRDRARQAGETGTGDLGMPPLHACPLHSATARIGVAKSDYFPRVFLTGAAAASGIWVNSSWIGPQGIFAVGPSFTLPIFNTGRTGAGVDSAEARAQIALDQYRLTVVQAFREVSDALVEYQKRKEFRVQQEALQVAARASAYATYACVDSWLTDFREDVGAIDVPVLVVQGTEDRILPWPSTGKRLAPLMKDVRVVPIEGGPHNIAWTHAEDVNRELLAFLRD